MIGREDVLKCLASERRGAFLSALAYWLTTENRGVYAQVSSAPEAANQALRCSNELLHIIAKQLWSSLGDFDAGYPDDAFVDILLGTADAFGGCKDSVQASLERALHSLAVPSRR